jgi:phosphoribosylformylglycinamidine synthase I
MKWGIVRFPGSNCDQDMFHAIRHVLAENAIYLWHKDTDLQNVDIVALPGGFSYGDYLRCGAIARFSPIMSSIIQHAQKGGGVIGICNGFQILCESRLLPGALIRNRNLLFRCEHVHLKDENLTQQKHPRPLKIPIAHGEGCYFDTPEKIRILEQQGRILLRYCEKDGNITPQANPNGSINNIAGICSQNRRIWGMMPHPERACEPALGSTDGLTILRAFCEQFSST